MAKSKDFIAQIKKATRRRFSAGEKIRIVLEGLRGEASISEICRREGIASSVYYKWSKGFLEAGKNGLTRDTLRDATSDEKDMQVSAKENAAAISDAFRAGGNTHFTALSFQD